MSSADALSEGVALDVPKDLSVEDVTRNIVGAAEAAAKTGDFLSFATVLDLSLGDPQSLSSDDAAEVLSTLYNILFNNEALLYRVGWDLPELLLKYIDRFFVGDTASLPAQKPFRLVMALFSLITEKGNPRELFVKACELMLATESKRNSDRVAALSLRDTPEPSAAPDNDETLNLAIDAFRLDDARQENVKFCTLFEVLRFSLQRIETPFPSRYLLEAARTLLQVADDKNADILSVSTYARRMFLFARDFSMASEESVSEEEMQRVRHLLVNFVSHTADVVLRKYSLKWAERLYLQMRHKVALAPPTERDFVYTETEYTRRMSDVISRMAQLILSYDYDPQVAYYKFMHIPPPARFDINSVPSTTIEGLEVEGYWARQLVSGPSVDGLGLLTTQLHFDGSRAKDPSPHALKIHGKDYVERIRSAGKRDMSLYWSLWLSNFFSEEFLSLVEREDLEAWLRSLLTLIADSKSKEEQFVTGSIIARALRFQSPDYARKFCLDVMKHSSSAQEQFVVVEILKALATGKIGGQVCTLIACCQLTDADRLEIAQTARDAIRRLMKESNCVPFYYLNLLTVVPTDKPTVLQITDELDQVAAQCSSRAVSESCTQHISMLREASEQLRRWATS